MKNINFSGILSCIFIHMVVHSKVFYSGSKLLMCFKRIIGQWLHRRQTGYLQTHNCSLHFAHSVVVKQQRGLLCVRGRWVVEGLVVWLWTNGGQTASAKGHMCDLTHSHPHLRPEKKFSITRCMMAYLSRTLNNYPPCPSLVSFFYTKLCKINCRISFWFTKMGLTFVCTLQNEKYTSVLQTLI